MSTNIYWHVPVGRTPLGDAVEIDDDDPRIHIGKFYSRGERGVAFIWAQDERVVVDRLVRGRDHEGDPELVVDEFGGHISCSKMLADLAIARGGGGMEYHSIGKSFS